MKLNQNKQWVLKIGNFFTAFQIIENLNPVIQLSINYRNIPFSRHIMIMLLFYKSGIAISIGFEK